MIFRQCPPHVTPGGFRRRSCEQSYAMQTGVGMLSRTLLTGIFSLPFPLYHAPFMIALKESVTLPSKKDSEGIAPFVRHRPYCRLLSAPHHRVSDRKHPRDHKCRGEPGRTILRIPCSRAFRRRCSRLCSLRSLRRRRRHLVARRRICRSSCSRCCRCFRCGHGRRRGPVPSWWICSASAAASGASGAAGCYGYDS